MKQEWATLVSLDPIDEKNDIEWIQITVLHRNSTDPEWAPKTIRLPAVTAYELHVQLARKLAESKR